MSETITVQTGPDGAPVSFTLDGKTWFLGAEPIRWFERVPWWTTRRSMGRSEGEGRIDVEVWRLQARLGHNPDSELVTFELVHDRGGPMGWSVRSRS